MLYSLKYITNTYDKKNKKELSKHYVHVQQLHAPSSRLDTSRFHAVPINALRLVLLCISSLILPQR